MPSTLGVMMTSDDVAAASAIAFQSSSAGPLPNETLDHTPWGNGTAVTSGPSDVVMTWPKECLVIPLVPGSMPWEQPEDLVSYETQQVFVRVVSIGLLSLLFCLGSPANVLNMIVFFRQGIIMITFIKRYAPGKATSFCLFHCLTSS